MAKKVKSKSGTIYCSYCGTSVEEDDAVCPNCGEELDMEVQKGKVCPSCGAPVGKLEDVCPNCGTDLISPEGENEEDEEYLSKLMGWGDEVEEDMGGRVEEKQKAMEVFKKVATGEEEAKDGLKLDFKKPFKGILKAVKGNIRELDEEIEEVERKIERSEGEEKEHLENKLEALTEGKDYLEVLEMNISNMNSAVKTLLDKQRGEIEEKREELRERVSEFKKVVKRKEKEKKKIENKKEELENKEEELKEWETQLKAWNEELQDREFKLEKMKQKYASGEEKLEEIEAELPKEGSVSPEEWMEEQRHIQKELFQLKDMWGEDEEIEEISEDNIGVIKEKIKKKEEEWKGKIEELEDELEKVREEKEELKKKELETGVEIEEVRDILTVLDRLLGELPEEKIREFAQSEDFDLYEKIMDAFGL